MIDIRSFLRISMFPYRFLLLLGALVIAAPLWAANASERPVRIGGTLSLSGRHATIGKYKEQGFRLWVRDVNARGGMLGRPVELTLLDDQSDPAVAVELYRRLIVQEHVDLVFAPYTSAITEAILPLTAKQGYPIIASGASADRIWEQGYQHVFGVFLPAGRFAVGFFEMLVQSGVDRIAIFYDDNAFSRDVAAGARTWAERFGLTVVHDELFPSARPDFARLAGKARDARAEVVFLASYLSEAIGMRKAFSAIKWLPRAYYAPLGPGTEEYLRALGRDADGVFSTSQWEAVAKGPRVGRDVFTEEYIRAYGQAPSYFAATAYASGELFEAAARKAGNLDREALRKALATMDAMSVIGRYGVDRTGLQIKNNNLITQRQQGRQEVVWPEEYRTAAPRFK